MFLSLQTKIWLTVEVTYDNIFYHPIIEFSKDGICTMLLKGNTESEVICSIFNSVKPIAVQMKIKNCRLLLKSDEHSFYLFDNCPIKNYREKIEKYKISGFETERKKFLTLTPTELKVLEHNHSGQGKDAMAIEKSMKLSTYNLHIKRIYKKLELHNSKQLYIWTERYLVILKMNG